MAERDFSPISIPNTFRDSNDKVSLTQEIVLPSAPNIEDMDFAPIHRHSIIRPVEPERLPSPRINNPPNQSYVKIKPLVKSIVRSNESDEERPPREQHERIHNGSLINNNDNSVFEAAGYDPTQLGEPDTDEAYALQLQQEEYSRESMIPIRHPYLPFQVEADDETASATPAMPPYFYEPINQHSMNDEQLAAHLQEQENQTRQRYRRPPVPQFMPQRRQNTASSQASDTDEPEIVPIPPFARYGERQPSYDEDDSDEGNPYMDNPHAFFQFLANRNRSLPEGGVPAFFPGFRGHGGYRGRGYRRTGNIQETEDDFGPDDYERLLQLDDTINKKKLTKDQINTIKIENFRRTSNNSDEENKCGVCLELFEENQHVRRFPCRHLYHKDCADRWLQENNVCPICRDPPIKNQPTNNHRNHRGVTNTRRQPNNHRSSNNRNNNTTTTTQHPNHRGQPSSQRQS